VNELHAQFVIEARELVRQATDDLIALERDGSAPARVDRVFRAFHTLKGSAGVVELPAMTLLLHAAEDLLTAVRGGEVAVSADIIDLSLACLDQVSRWVDDFDAAAALPADAGDAGRMLAERMRAFFQRRRSSRSDAADTRPVGLSHRAAQSLSASRRDGPVRLQFAATGHGRGRPRRPGQDFPHGAGPGPY